MSDLEELANDIRGGISDPVPDGWYTSAEIFEAAGINRNNKSAWLRIRELVRSGRWEMRKIRQKGKLVNIYRKREE